MAEASELAINTSVTAIQMAETIFGLGVTVVDATYVGADTAAGLYSGANTTMPGVAPSDSGLILSTGSASDITNSSGSANADTSAGTAQGTAGDSQLDMVAGAQTADAAILTVSFIPDGDLLTMKFVFLSDEHVATEMIGFVGGDGQNLQIYSYSNLNDVFAVWINGTKAELAVGSGDVTALNINGESNSDLFVYNSNSTFNTEMNGFTVTLTLNVPVTKGEVNTIKIGIADASDSARDSNVMIAADSMQINVVATDDTITTGPSSELTFDPLANDASVLGKLVITEINGQPVVEGSTITLASGEVVRLNGDGTLTLVSQASPGQTQLTYTASDADGTTDVGIVTVNTLGTLPCFTRGTMIDTPDGPRPVESLRPGDPVCTRDHGVQPVRWAGMRSVPGLGRFAPVMVDAGTFGAHDRLTVSQQHRILLTDGQAELLFHKAGVLVSALHLVDGRTVRIEATPRLVCYVHLLFDRHQILISNGLPSESFFPGDGALAAVDAGARAEIVALFPSLATCGGNGYGRTAHTVLRRHEARVLRTALTSQSKKGVICATTTEFSARARAISARSSASISSPPASRSSSVP